MRNYKQYFPSTFLTLLYNISMKNNKVKKVKQPRGPKLTKIIWILRGIALAVIVLGITLSALDWAGFL